MSKADIGLDDAGMDDDTSPKNNAYDNIMVIDRDTRSPESMGRTNTSGLIRANSKVGKITKTTWYSGCRLIVILTWNS